MAGICAGCRQEIPDRRFLNCSICHQDYDLECANVSDQCFYNTFTEEHKRSWKCQLCRSKEPKTDNKNTPIRAHHSEYERNDKPYNYQQTSTVDQNVTIRKMRPRYTEEKSTTSDDELDSTISPHGNTLIIESPNFQIRKDAISCLEKNEDQVTVQELTSILQQNNQQILTAIHKSFRNEIENAISEIKAGFKQSFEKITEEQVRIEKDLSNLNCKITQLDKKRRTIQAENENLLKKIQYLESNLHLPTH